MFKCEQTYVSASYCMSDNNSICYIEPDIPRRVHYYLRVEYSDVINHGLCSVSYSCSC